MQHIVPPNILDTKRLILRPFHLDDADAMFHGWCKDDRVTKTLSFETHQSVDDTKIVLSRWVQRYQNGPYYHWAIVEKSSQALIGSIGEVDLELKHHRIEIGYCLAYDYWHQGLMTEALIEVTRYLFDVIGFNKIVIAHASDNMASGRVMEKASYQMEGILKENRINKEGIYIDMHLYGLTKTMYQKHRNV